MKLASLSCIVTIALGTIACPSRLQAADEPAGNPQRRDGSNDRAERAKAITDELKLTSEQQEKLRPILMEDGKKMREIFQDSKLSREEKMAKLKESRDALREKLKKILTPAQLEKWDKLREQRTQRRTRGAN